MQLATKSLASPGTTTPGPVNGGEVGLLKPRLPLDRTFKGYLTDTQRGYEDSGIEFESGEERNNFSYYMTRQARNSTKNRPKSGVKLKGISARKLSVT